MSGIHFVNVYLKQMSDFGRALYTITNVCPEKLNTVYKKFFSVVTPLAPSRACVCVNWVSKNWNTKCVAMEFYGSKLTKKNLHVQSISRWAPACIGPYAQVRGSNYFYKLRKGNSVEIPVGTGAASFLHLAGQIPLNPSTMTIIDSNDAREQLNLCFKHQVAVENSLAASLKVIDAS